MALTDQCDIYFAVRDAGVDRIVRAVTQQRPSLVNLGTVGFVQNPQRLCERIDALPIVTQRNNPLVREVPPLPIALTGYGAEWCLQLTALELDISPGNIISLPPELNPPLADQRLALHAGACFGFGCPGSELVDRLPYLPPPGSSQGGDKGNDGGFKDDRLRDRREIDRPVGDGRVIANPVVQRPLVTIPADKPLCTCLDVFAVVGAEFVGPSGHEVLKGRLDGLEIVDLAPTTLEDSIECYLSLVVKLGLLPQLASKVLFLPPTFTELFSVSIEPTPESAALPHNPALEDDQLKVFLDLDVGPGSGGSGGGGGGGGGGSSPPADPGVPRGRTRTGPFDLTAAVAERAVQDLFNTVRDGFSKSGSGSKDFGPFSITYAAEVHLENGTLDLHSDGTISLKELDVAFNTLQLCLGLDIPKVCIGGFCIIGIPFDGCLVHAPKICLFEDDPDIEVCLDIGPFVRIELSAVIEALSKYAVNPLRAGLNDWDAVIAKQPNHWQIYIDPVTLDVDLFDVADIVGNLLEDALDAVLDTILGPLPGWAKDLIKAILGPVIDIIRGILDLGDDIQEWLSDHLGVSLGLFDFILTAVADYLAKGHPIVQIPDPFTILPADGGLIPVLVPIEFLGIDVDDVEMQLDVDLGG